LPIPGRKVEDMQGHHRWGYNVGAYNDFRKNWYPQNFRTWPKHPLLARAYMVAMWFDLRTGTLLMNSDSEIRYTRGYDRIVLWWKRKITCAQWNVKSRFTLLVKYPTSRLRFESSVVSANVKALSYSVIRCGTLKWKIYMRFTWRQIADRILRTIIAPLFGTRAPVFSHALIHSSLLPPAW